MISPSDRTYSNFLYSVDCQKKSDVKNSNQVHHIWTAAFNTKKECANELQSNVVNKISHQKFVVKPAQNSDKAPSEEDQTNILLEPTFEKNSMDSDGFYLIEHPLDQEIDDFEIL